MMFLLLLLWLLLGILVGLLATAARYLPTSWARHGWLYLTGLGALAAFGGGWLGVLLVGRTFATAMALWIAVVCVTLLPQGIERIRQFLSQG
jgi:uncharacterized membrane protein YeaQ/YmgE (transglycosylase-associated protein family)